MIRNAKGTEIELKTRNQTVDRLSKVIRGSAKYGSLGFSARVFCEDFPTTATSSVVGVKLSSRQRLCCFQPYLRVYVSVTNISSAQRPIRMSAAVDWSADRSGIGTKAGG